jgi:hypothetical protein
LRKKENSRDKSLYLEILFAAGQDSNAQFEGLKLTFVRNIFFLLSGANGLTSLTEASCLTFLDHTQQHITVGRTPLDEGSARRLDLYSTTQHSTRDKHLCGIRISNSSKRAAADPRLGPLG